LHIARWRQAIGRGVTPNHRADKAPCRFG
jgi:hypothetical protein